MKKHTSDALKFRAIITAITDRVKELQQDECAHLDEIKVPSEALRKHALRLRAYLPYVDLGLMSVGAVVRHVTRHENDSTILWLGNEEPSFLIELPEEDKGST